MADNDSRSYRNRDSFAVEADLPARERPYDPLEELARLIGESGSPGDYDRGARRDPRSAFADAPPAAPAASNEQWRDDEDYAESARYEDDRYVAPADDARSVAPEGERYVEPAEEEDRYAPPRFAQAYPPDGGEAAYDEAEAATARRHPDEFGRAKEGRARSYDTRYRDDIAPPRSHGRQPPPLAPQSYDDDYADDGQWQDGHDGQSDIAEQYDDEDRPRHARRGVIALAVLGLVLVGGAASVFAYRAIYGDAILPALPPIIKAGDGPNKIIPPRGDAQAGTSSQTSVADAGNGEKLVPREEQPVDVQPSNPPPRVVATVPVMPSTPGPAPLAGPPPAPTTPTLPAASPFPPSAPPMVAAPAAAPPPGQAPAAGSAEPKKIHTLSIRPDQGRPSAPPAPVARTSSPPAPRSGAPLALVPSAQGEPPRAMEAPRTQVARTEAPRPAPTATEPAAAASTGGYGVQVSSQRSEAEAQAAFRELRAKYPKELGSREPVIRRADLGDKGTFYRALVGPFGSREQAVQMCSALKAAGGSCLVEGM